MVKNVTSLTFGKVNVIATKQNIFSPKLVVIIFLGVFGIRCVHTSVRLGTSHFLRLHYFATLFRHCLNKLKVQLSMGIHKIVLEHNR